MSNEADKHHTSKGIPGVDQISVVKSVFRSGIIFSIKAKEMPRAQDAIKSTFYQTVLSYTLKPDIAALYNYHHSFK
jgi:hypothetical protein